MGASVQSTAGSRGVSISFSNVGYTTFGGGVRVLATHTIRQFPLHFPFRASPCTTRFRTSSTSVCSFESISRCWSASYTCRNFMSLEAGVGRVRVLAFNRPEHFSRYARVTVPCSSLRKEFLHCSTRLTRESLIHVHKNSASPVNRCVFTTQLKVNFNLEQATKAQRGCGGIALLFL